MKKKTLKTFTYTCKNNCLTFIFNSECIAINPVKLQFRGN